MGPALRGAEPTGEYDQDPLLRGIVNVAVARFVYERPPRMPSLTDAIKLLSAGLLTDAIEAVSAM